MIAGGRHPVIEKLLEERGERFVPNDLYLDDDIAVPADHYRTRIWAANRPTCGKRR